ncbi:MAG: TonB-dependent receptor plug domain-containing protein, partial [Usitatibacteraceae bacterium]
MRNFKITCLLLCGASALSMMPTSAHAQDASDSEIADSNEIIVTAGKRPENIQDVPMSVSALSGDALEQRGINNIAQLQSYVPSLRFVTSNTARNSGVFMRGIGQNGTNQGIEPSVGVFLDGVYLPIPGPLQGNLRDISTVEVLRGPQGTLYGRNTPVGAININTRAPSQDTEASVTASYGNYNDMQLSGYLGGGLGENLAGRVSFWFSDRDGYEHNLATGKDINSVKQWGVRTRLKWDPSSNLTVNL